MSEVKILNITFCCSRSTGDSPIASSGDAFRRYGLRFQQRRRKHLMGGYQLDLPVPDTNHTERAIKWGWFDAKNEHMGILLLYNCEYWDVTCNQQTCPILKLLHFVLIGPETICSFRMTSRNRSEWPGQATPFTKRLTGRLTVERD
jgi:hypothetical protein